MKKILQILLFLSLFFGQKILAEDLVISEIAWMGTKGSYHDEWIELHNFGREEINLNGWVLVSGDDSPNIKLTGIIPPKSFWILERTDDTTLSSQAKQIYTGSLNNNGEILYLKNPQNKVIDETPLGEWTAGDNKTKQTMERINFRESGKSAQNWENSITISAVKDSKNNSVLGTPGNKNSVTPPELFWETDFFSTPATGKITEVSPTNIGENKEWLEIMIESDGATDLTEWKISRGKYSKKFKNILAKIHLNEEDFPDKNLSGKNKNHIKFPNDKLILEPPNIRGYFWIKAPFSLPDSGGEIILYNEKDEIMDNFIYSKTKKGKKNGISYGEVWNKNLETDGIFPQIVIENSNTEIDSRGEKNKDAIIYNAEILVSEVSPSWKTPNGEKGGYVEIFISPKQKNVNLKYLNIKHNGTEIFSRNNDFIINEDTFLVIFFGDLGFESTDNILSIKAKNRKTISKSGTIEVNIWGGTSWEKPIDVLCWSKENYLNKTETKRLQKFRENLDWENDCFNYQKLKSNQSIARLDTSKDSNQKSDFFIYNLGSLGFYNNVPSPLNLRPVSIIEIQSISNNSINLNGGNSYDPNGDFDIEKWNWRLEFWQENKKIFANHKSFKKNPLTWKLENHKNLDENFCKNSFYKISLKISDTSNQKSENLKKFPLIWKGNKCVLQTKKTQEVSIIKREKFQEFSLKETWEEDFFADFLEINKDKNPKIPKKEISENLESPNDFSKLVFRRDKFFALNKISPNRLRKNIGLALNY